MVNWATALTNSINLPQQIVASGVTAIAAGSYHSLFLKSDGSLWAMGYNGDGELGDGTYNLYLPTRANCGRLPGLTIKSPASF